MGISLSIQMGACCLICKPIAAPMVCHVSEGGCFLGWLGWFFFLFLRQGLQIEMHAIGDAAFDQATRALKAALDDYPREDHRHGIIHACLPTPEGIAICRDYKIQIPLQTAFIDWPQEPDRYLREILGNRIE